MARAKMGMPGVTIAGRLGGVVFVPLADGRLIVRSLPRRLPPRTELQQTTAARFKPVARAWHGLSRDEAEAWFDYAQGVGRRSDGRAPTAYNAFTALASKCLQMRPDAAVPSLPPTVRFLGDGIEVAISGSPSLLSGGKEGLGEGESHLGESLSAVAPPSDSPSPAPSSPGTNHPVKEGVLTFTARGPNSQGLVTELLAQRLKGRNRRPSMKEYRSLGFVAFAAGALEVEVAVEGGAWACAVRFVRAATARRRSPWSWASWSCPSARPRTSAHSVATGWFVPAMRRPSPEIPARARAIPRLRGFLYPKRTIGLSVANSTWLMETVPPTLARVRRRLPIWAARSSMSGKSVTVRLSLSTPEKEKVGALRE